MRPSERAETVDSVYQSREVEDDVFDNGFLRVEHDNYYIACEGRHIPLPRLEFLLFSRLAKSFDRVVRSEELWQAAWGGKKPYNSESLHVHMYRLRRRFALYGLEISNMVNVGYRLGLADYGGGPDEHGNKEEAR